MSDDDHVPVTVSDDARADVYATETCDGADGHECVREDSGLTRGEDEIHVTEYGPGSDRAGNRRVLCSECHDKQSAVQIADMPDLAAMYSEDELRDLQERFPDVLTGVELETETGDGDE